MSINFALMPLVQEKKIRGGGGYGVIVVCTSKDIFLCIYGIKIEKKMKFFFLSGKLFMPIILWNPSNKKKVFVSVKNNVHICMASVPIKN